MTPRVACVTTLKASATVKLRSPLTTRPLGPTATGTKREEEEEEEVEVEEEVEEDKPFLFVVVTSGNRASNGDGRYAATASMTGWTPMLRKLEPHNTGVTAHATVARWIACWRAPAGTAM